MKKQPLKPWEIALAAGLIVGMLATPAHAGGTILSRWPTQTLVGPPEYQVSLFPFAVGRIDAQTLVPLPSAEPVEYEVKFKVAEWWDALTDAISP